MGCRSLSHFNKNMFIIYSAIRAAVGNIPDTPQQEETIKSIQVLSHDWGTVRSERVRGDAFYK